MDPKLFKLMALQGELKIKFLMKGVPETMAHKLAGIALDVFAKSAIIESDYKETYASLSEGAA